MTITFNVGSFIETWITNNLKKTQQQQQKTKTKNSVLKNRIGTFGGTLI